MKNFEREEFNADELEQISEFVPFHAEEYKCKEEYLNKNEEYKVKEIQSQSFIKNQENNDNKNINNSKNEYRKKISKHLNSSINSNLATSSSCSIAATFTITIAVVIGIVNTSLVDKYGYGKLNFNNYKIEIYQKYNSEFESEELTKGVYLYFEEKMEKDYIAQVINLQTSQVLPIDLDRDYVYFDDLVLDQYKFEVQILNKQKEVENSYYIKVDTTCDIEFTMESSFDFLFTYNEDGTINLYYYSLFYENITTNIKTENELKLTDINGNDIDYTYKEENGVLIIENIFEEHFNIVFSSYYIENNNYYLINRNIIYELEPYALNWYANLDFDQLTLNIFDEPMDDINVIVEYLDLSLTEEFVISKDNYKNYLQQILTLSQISEKINVIIEGNFIKSQESEYINNYKGELIVEISDSLLINQVVTSEIELERIEVLNSSYDSGYSSPTKLYFDGYIKNGDYFNVEIYDSTNLLIESFQNLNNINEIITINDLDTNQELILKYELFESNGNKLTTDTYYFFATIPNEYQNLNYSSNSLNPGDVYVTYNDDNSFNAYFYINFNNETEYDLYCKIDLIKDNVPYYTLISNQIIGEIKNIDLDYYGINYSFLLKDGLTYYAINDLVYPSGTIGYQIEDGYSIEGYLSYNFTENEKIYELYTNSLITSDLAVKIILDGIYDFSLVVPLTEIIYDSSSTFLLDLSNYEYKEAFIEITGIMNNYANGKEEIEEIYDVAGNAGILTKLSITITN